MVEGERSAPMNRWPRTRGRAGGLSLTLRRRAQVAQRSRVASHHQRARCPGRARRGRQAQDIDDRHGVPFFDHMLDQVARHGGLDLHRANARDLEIDAHTVEDTSLAFRTGPREAFGTKAG